MPNLIDADALKHALGVEGAKKHGNSTELEMERSYKSYMGYEIADEIDGAEGVCTSEELEALKSDLALAFSILKMNCEACTHYRSINGPCKDCWLETYPGHPEKTKRSNWVWKGITECRI